MSEEFDPSDDYHVIRAIRLAEQSTPTTGYGSDSITPTDVEMAMTKGSGPVWFAWTGTKDDALYTAVTGNGPCSEANARFYSFARDAVLALGREVLRLRSADQEEGG